MSRVTLSVFEHETIRPGARTLSGDLVPARLDLDALARFNDRHEQAYFRLGYRSVTFQQFVGFVSVGDVSFEVLPKADRNVRPGSTARWKQALIAMLEGAMDVQLHSPTDSPQKLANTSLIDLVAASFLKEVSTLRHEGLARAYRAIESNGTTFRGRLMVAENVRENLVRPDRFYVRSTTFDTDVPVNQILAEALRALDNLAIASSLRARVREHLLSFDELTPLRVNAQTFARLTLGRSTLRYEKALVLARMILERIAPSLTRGHTDVFALLFDMNRLWESFVAAMLRRAELPGLVVRSQSPRIFWTAEEAMSKTVRPDIVLVDASTHAPRIVLDTKWKVADARAPSDADLKQMFVYNELYDCAESILLYPASGPERTKARGTFAVDKGHGCRLAELGLFDAGIFQRTKIIADLRSIVGIGTASGATHANS